MDPIIHLKIIICKKQLSQFLGTKNANTLVALLETTVNLIFNASNSCCLKIDEKFLMVAYAVVR